MLNICMIFLLEQTPQRDPYLNWALIAFAVATIFYTVVVRPAMKKKKDPLAKMPGARSLTGERTVERQMQNLLVELSEMTRAITAQLDTRAQKLQLMIQDADERIAELQRLEQGHVQQRSQPISDQMWNSAPVTPARLAPPPDPVDEQHKQVYSLADRGQSAGDIARELNRPRGEVELILALRPRAAG